MQFAGNPSKDHEIEIKDNESARNFLRNPPPQPNFLVLHAHVINEIKNLKHKNKTGRQHDF